MKTIAIDEAGRSVSFSVPDKLYSEDGLKIAAQIFSARADVYLEEARGRHELTLKAKRRTVDAAGLAALAGEFRNELLNQEYRFLVGRFNQKITSLIVTQTLFAARGGETPPEAPAAEKTPEFQAEVARLMSEADAEIRRTMPKKLPPQGNPLPPAPEGLLA